MIDRHDKGHIINIIISTSIIIITNTATIIIIITTIFIIIITHLKFGSPVFVVEGGYGPGDADAEKDVDGVASGDVTDRIVGIFVLR